MVANGGNNKLRGRLLTVSVATFLLASFLLVLNYIFTEKIDGTIFASLVAAVVTMVTGITLLKEKP